MFTDGNIDVVAGDRVSKAMINCHVHQKENDTHLIGSHWEHHYGNLLNTVTTYSQFQWGIYQASIISSLQRELLFLPT
jgi:hypothetical protein